MATNENDALPPSAEEASESTNLSRRKFLGGMGGAAAAAATGGLGLGSVAKAALADDGFDFNGDAANAARVRQNACFDVRMEAAAFWRDQPVTNHPVNGDETLYPNWIGNYSKGLPHNSFGEVDPAAYQSLLKACTTGDPADFEEVILDGLNKLTNPQSGLAFELEGADSHALSVPAPPTLASAEEAGEGVELYWMALLRDVNFLSYGSNSEVAAACADINRFGNDFKGPRAANGEVTPKTLFRDVLPGCKIGPYISQYFWLNTPFGVENVDRHMRTKKAGTDHLTNYANWLANQSGLFPETETADFDPVRRYIRNGRDLAQWVHIDVLFQAYFNACLILLTPPNAADPKSAGIGCPFNKGNPYTNSATQVAFTTFGPPHFKALMCEVASRALKVTWHKKWQVHRRLRPEAWGGLVHNQKTADRYPGVIEARQLNSPALDRVHDKYGTFLMPMAFGEGCPTHPSYTAGHATVAGACVTILKALFDETFVIPNPVVPSADGLSLVKYLGPHLTVGGELNKLASNVATGRNIAGVHWRSDALESLRVGEKLAISILRDQRGTYNEPFDGFTFTRFDGSPITV